ncbi:MAG TPA: O-antigen ligase family protein [Thermoanaerobaculia bacterium]|nr:O-antigen ligase family protein [Thermoanaerobaculia bacterium]
MAPSPSLPLDPAQEGPWLRWARRFYALHLLTLFGLAISNAFLGLALIFSWPAFRQVVRGQSLGRLRLQPMLAPLAAYYLWLGAAVVASPLPRQSVGSLGEIFLLSSLLLAPLLLGREGLARRLTDQVIASGALLAFWALGQYLQGYGGIDQRIRGPFSHWMTLAGVLLICDLLLIAQLTLEAASRRSVWRWIALAAINVALLGSLTRNAWLALGVTLIGFASVRRPRWLLALPLVAALFFLIAPQPIVSRALSITNLSDPSNYDRLCMADAGLHMIAEHPLFGIGPDLVQSRYTPYRDPTAPRYWVPHLHDTFLEIAAERGLPALAAYFWLMAVAVRTAFRRYREQGGHAGPHAALYVGAILALVGFNVAGLFEYNWGDSEVQRLALFVLALPFCGPAGKETGDELRPELASPDVPA